MARGRVTRRSRAYRQTRSVRRRRRPQTRSSKRRSVLPPAQSITGHIFRNTVQCLWDLAQGALRCGGTQIQAVAPNPNEYRVTCTDGYLFAQDWKEKFRALFREYKVHSITARYMPYASIDQIGDYLMTLYDVNENWYDTNVDVVGQPGSVFRHCGRPAMLRWIPTEPDDRNWQQFGDGHTWCRFGIKSLEDNYNSGGQLAPVNLAGKVVVDVDASFRGKPGPNGALEIPCQCRKCLRMRLAARMSRERDAQGKDSPASSFGMVAMGEDDSPSPLSPR